MASTITVQAIPPEVLLHIFGIVCLENYDHRRYPVYDEDQDHSHHLPSHTHEPETSVVHVNPEPTTLGQTQQQQSHTQTLDTLDLLHPLWTISQVCRAWRTLAHESMGTFWGTIVLLPHSSRLEDRLKRAKYRITRSLALSADQPLHLNLRDMAMQRDEKLGPWLRTVLGPEYRRIRYLDARCDDQEAWFPLPLDPPEYEKRKQNEDSDPSSNADTDSDEDDMDFFSPDKPVFESMEHLILSFPESVLMPGSFPSLRTASFNGLHPGIPFVPWGQLEVVRLAKVPESLLDPIVAMSTNARLLRVESKPSTPLDEEDSETPRTPTHPHLTSLTVSPLRTSCLSSIVAPALTTVAVLPRFNPGSPEHREFVTGLGAMLERSGADLREVRIKGMWALCHSEVVRMLGFVPGLKVLEVGIQSTINLRDPTRFQFDPDQLQGAADELSDTAICITLMSLIMLLRTMASPTAGPHAFQVCRMLRVLRVVVPPLNKGMGAPRWRPPAHWRLEVEENRVVDSPAAGTGQSASPAEGSENRSPGAEGERRGGADERAPGGSGPNAEVAAGPSRSTGDGSGGSGSDLALDDLVSMISSRHVRGGLKEVDVHWAGWKSCPWSGQQVERLKLLGQGGLRVVSYWEGGGFEFGPGNVGR